MIHNFNERLVNKYREWLNEIKENAPQLLSEKYSNPYFSSIPDGWFDTKGPRIMIVGEEGFGTWGCGKGDGSISADEIEKIQFLNYSNLKKQLGESCCDTNYSSFWKRFRKIAGHGICCWTNIDKIHTLHNKKCALTSTERKVLHSVRTRLLHEEISLLNPTHVVFFGWYGTSLQHELPEIYSKMYPQGPNDNSVWNQTVVLIKDEGRKYIFCYHPSWGYRNAGYEDKVMEVFKTSL